MFKKALKEHISVFSDLSFIEENIIELFNMILNTIDKKGKILIFGNGGSAADAQHFAAELVVKFEKRQPLLQLHSQRTHQLLQLYQMIYLLMKSFQGKYKPLPTKKIY